MPIAKLVTLLSPTRRRFQFRLRTLFVLVAVICVFLAVRENRQHKRRAAIAKTMGLGGAMAHSRTLRMPDRLEPVNLGLWAKHMGDNPLITLILNEKNLPDPNLVSP